MTSGWGSVGTNSTTSWTSSMQKGQLLQLQTTVVLTVKLLLPDLLKCVYFFFLFFYRLSTLSTDLNSSPENRLLTRTKA